MTYNSKTDATVNVSKNDVSNSIFSGVQSLLKRRSTPWVGTMTQLDSVIRNRRQVPENFPGSASALRVALNKVVRRLRNAGVKVKFTRSTDHMRTRLVQISVKH